MMKLWMFVILITGSICSFGQQDATNFTADPTKTVSEMNAFFNTANRQYKDEVDAIQKMFPAFWAALSTQQQQTFITLANKMIKYKRKPVPHFSDFIRTYKTIATRGLSEKDMQKLLLSLNQDIEDNLSIFSARMNFYHDLLTSNQLYKTSGGVWYVRNCDDFRFEFDGKTKIIFPSGTLVCTNGKDSVLIEKISGIYFPNENKFIGNKGISYWRKAGFDERVFATFEKYEVSTKLTKVQIENVQYHNPAYFSKSETGTLEDKITVQDDIDNNSTFPRFTSYRKDIRIVNFYENVDYCGGMHVRGANVFGQGDTNMLAQMIFKRNKDVAVTASSNSFILKPEAVYSNMCKMAILIGNDSIAHSAIQMRYDANKRDIWFIRGDKGPERMPFTNSYHKLETMAEAVHWDMKEEKIDFISAPGPTEQVAAILESENYFAQSRLMKMHGMSDINPMFTLYEFFRKNNVKKAPLETIVKWFGYGRSDVQSLMFNLVEFGFIDYDVLTDVITYRSKLGNYLQNDIKKKDYDVIEFRSIVKDKKANATLSLLNYDLDIFGINMIILSDSQMVTVFPKDNHITVQKNRDFLFQGKVEAGLFDFWVSNSRFDYDRFLMDFNVIDSIVFYVEDKSAGVNMYGEHPLVKVRNYVEDVSGTLYIDKPNNKSSSFAAPGFPYFESKSNGRVTYNHDFVHKGVYDKNRFYYSTDKFVLRDLDDFDTDSLSFSGYLNSGGIFPDIAIPLKVRPDFSLGFVHNTEAGGLPAYQGKGMFTGKIDLSNMGLRCTGGLDFSQSHCQGKNMLFFLDSMNAMVDDYRIDAQMTGAEFPPVSAQKVYAHWDIYSNQMFVNDTESRFRMYNNESRLKGQLIVSNDGVKGSGLFTYDIAEFVSNEYDFLHHQIKSDTTAMVFKDVMQDDFYLKTENHKMMLDMNKQWGEFESNFGKQPIIFPINQYMTYAIKFEWKIPEMQLSFVYEDPYANINVNGTETRDLYEMKSVGNELISIHPAQDSLRFTTARLDFELKKYELSAYGVRFIETGDAAVFPRSGDVKIYKRAEMGKLSNSRILTNTYTQYHDIVKAETYISSRKSYHANGYFNYIDETKKKQEIFFDTIWVNRNIQTRAEGVISYMADFTLNPYFGFSGKVALSAEEEFLTFNGGVSLKHACYPNIYAPVRYKGAVNPDSVFIPIEANTKDTANRPVVAAIASNSAGEIYPAFARAKDVINNPEYLSVHGLLMYDKELSSFVVTTAEKFENPDVEANVIYLHTKRCQVRGSGKLNLGAEFGRVTFDPRGEIVNYIADDSAVVQLASPFDFPFDKACLDIVLDRLATNMSLDALDPSESSHYRSVLRSLLGEKEFERQYPLLKQNYRFPRLPKALAMNLIFADLKMTWHADKKAFVNIGQIGISVFGGSEINRYVPGILEIEKKTTSKSSNKTALKFYFEVGDDWFYFQYDGKTMMAISSVKAFNEALKAVDPKLKNLPADKKKGLAEYRYSTGSLTAKRKFLEKYQPEE